MLNYFPKFFTTKAIILYFIILIIINVVFFMNAMPLIWWVFGIVEVCSFFYFSNQLTKSWSQLSPKVYYQRLFIWSLIIRISWVIFSYLFYIQMNGHPFESYAADSQAYHEEATWLTDMILKGNIQPYLRYIKDRYSDMGYPFYLGFQYVITGKSILIARIIKALLSSVTCLLIYKFSKRNFGESVARVSGIFCMLMPNLIYYTGLHLKETEMLFLAVYFIERADFMMRSEKHTFVSLLPTLLLLTSLFFFRTVLGIAALFALFTALFFSSHKIMSFDKRLIVSIWVASALTFFVGGEIFNEIESVWLSRSENQKSTLEWRSVREGGNKFAKYASSAVFAPMIFVIPFPTMINIYFQQEIMLMNGGNYVKNILAFFVLFAGFWIIKERKVYDFLLIGTFTLGYLLIVAVSSFAHSERFHLPALPFILILAAFGLSKIDAKAKNYFYYYMAFIFVCIVAWNWFKLAGRGLL